MITLMSFKSFSNDNSVNHIRIVTINDTLHSIVLEDNQETFPSYLKNFPNLKNLQILFCDYKIIPDYFNMFQELETLEIYKCYNLDYNDLIFKLSKNRNLKELSLNGDSFSSIPNRLSHLENLEILDMSDNQITMVDEDIFRMNKLNSLDLSKNFIAEFDTKGIENYSISELILISNNLNNIPKGLVNLKGLKTLNLSSNQDLDLEKVCDLIPHLDNLECLIFMNTIKDGLPQNVMNLKLVKKLVVFGEGLTREDYQKLDELGVKHIKPGLYK